MCCKIYKNCVFSQKGVAMFLEMAYNDCLTIRDDDHLAIACLNEIDYLVTWNCAHICNAEVIKKLVKINDQLGVHTPIICAPESLMEEDDHVRSNCL